MNFRYQTQELPERHQLGLKWFKFNEGQTLLFPEALDSGQFLATRANGIYKPADWLYALSIRVMLGSPYKDGEFFSLNDQGWVCAYHQENNSRDLANSDQLFTNRGLQSCLVDKVPIGILKQSQSESDGGSRYKVLGLGAVVAKIGSYFVLTDLTSAATLDVKSVVEELLRHEAELRLSSLTSDENESQQSFDFDDGDKYKEKIKVWAQIVRRQGQGKFREELLRAYNHKCCITGTSEKSVLDAAHIIPYNGPPTNLVSNGLLLRTDLHALFDLNLLGIEPNTLQISIHHSVIDSNYRSLETKPIQLPTLPSDRPAITSLVKKWEDFNLNL